MVSAGQAADGTSIRIGFGGPTYRRVFHPNAIEEEQAKIVELGEGQEAAGVDIAMGRPVRTYEVLGRVVSAETGQPIPNVVIGHGALREGMSRPTSFGSSGNPTNARGEFRIENLLPGRYSAFLFNMPAFGLSEASNEFYSDPVPFEISETNVSGIEIRVHRAGSITGVIAAEDGNTQAVLSQAAQSSVYAFPVASGPGAPPPPPMPVVSSSQNRIQPDGSFRISGLSPGKVRVSLSGIGLQLVRIERDGVPSGDSTLEVAPGEQITGLRLIVSYGTGVIRGEVKIVGEQPQGGRIMVSLRRTNVVGGTGTSVEADSRGRFLAERLPPGEYEVTARMVAMPNMATTVTMTATTTATGGGNVGGGGNTVVIQSGGGSSTPPPTGQVPAAQFPSVKQNVTVANGAETPITLTLDLSKK
jgi:hypothetical protein